MKSGKFLITNYAMGRVITTLEFKGTLEEAKLRSETMEPLGLPSNHPKCAPRTRIIGIKRI